MWSNRTDTAVLFLFILALLISLGGHLFLELYK